MPRRALPLLIAFLIAGVSPQAVCAQAQPTGFAFLRLEPSARAAALGGSFTAAGRNDVNGLFYNPALLSPSIHRMMSASYLNHVGDISAGFVAYGRDFGRVGTLAAGLRVLTWGGLSGSDEAGQETGDFGAADMAFTVAGSRPINQRLRYGASIHLLHSYFESYAATALAGDLGLSFYLEERQLSIGASLNNLGLTIDDLGNRNDHLPVDLRLSVAKRLRHVPLLLSVTAYNLHDPGNAVSPADLADRILQHVLIGGEFQFSESFHFRMGYNHRRHQMLKTRSRMDPSGASLGGGIMVARIRVDYAFSSWSEAGGLHQFTIQTPL